MHYNITNTRDTPTAYPAKIHIVLFNQSVVITSLHHLILNQTHTHSPPRPSPSPHHTLPRRRYTEALHTIAMLFPNVSMVPPASTARRLEALGLTWRSSETSRDHKLVQGHSAAGSGAASRTKLHRPHPADHTRLPPRQSV